MTDYLLHILAQGCLVATLAVSLNLLAGYCGLVSLGQMTFYALGAYSAALIASATSLGYAAAIPVALLAAMLLAASQSWATSSLKDDEFAIATFAMHALFWMLLMNWVDLTRGPLGISNIPPLQIFGFLFDVPVRFFPLPLMLLIVSLYVVRRLQRQPFGILMRMVRDDEVLAECFGRDVRALRRSVWFVAAVIASSAGVLHASYLGFVHPVTFSSMESALLLVIVIVGGPGTFWGPVIGAFLIAGLPEALRFIGLPVAQAANVRQILLGLVLVLVIFRVRVSNRARLSS